MLAYDSALERLACGQYVFLLTDRPGSVHLYWLWLENIISPPPLELLSDDPSDRVLAITQIAAALPTLF